MTADPSRARPQADPVEIRRRFARFVSLLFLPLLALLAVLGAREYAQQVEAERHALESTLGDRRMAVEGVVALVRSQGLMLAGALQSELDPGKVATRFGTGVDLGIGDRPLLLNRPNLASPDRGGLILGIPGELGPRATGRDEVAAMERLFLVQAAAKQADGIATRRSYFLSAFRDLAALYPWSLGADLLTPSPGRDGGFRALFDEAIMRAGPSEAGSWIGPRRDFSGLRTVVTYVTRVEPDGFGRGVVGLDLDLAEIEAALGGAAANVALRLAEGDREIARSRPMRLADGGEAPRPPPGGAGFETVTEAVAGTPWRLTAAVPDAAIRAAALRRTLPYGLAVLGLLATLALVLALLHRQLIDPAARLVAYIADGAASGPTPVPARIPRFWGAWFEAVRLGYARQRESLEAMREAQAFSQAVVDVSLDAILTLDEDGRILTMNPAAERILRLPAQAARGRSVAALVAVDDLASGAAGIEREARRADGEAFPAEVRLQPLRHGGRDLRAVYLRDLTQAKAQERTLAEQRQRLHQAEKMTAMGSLLAGVAHELNNPLAVVVAQSSLLEETTASPADRTRAQKINAAAQRCGRIIKTFLAMARQQAPVRGRVALADVARGSLELMGYGLRAAGVRVETRFDPAAPAVDGDADQLAQVMSNLVVNAQQALSALPADGRERRLVVEVRPDETGEAAVITVTDNGPGVPPEVRARIFEPYFTTKPAGVGTGIGLSVCRTIVAAHGGTLSLEDAPGGGARFRIVLPAAGEAVAEAQPVAQPSPAPARKRVLVVDDEVDVGTALADILGHLGADAVVVGSRADAVAAAAGGGFDAVMADLRMPGGGGIEIWRDLAARGHPLAGRFVFVTGDTVAGPPAITASQDGRAPLILEKPFGRAEVGEALRAATA